LPELPGPPSPPLPAGTPPPAPPARELARLSVLQGYDPSRILAGDSHQSAVDLGIRLAPVDWAGLSYNASIGVAPADLIGYNVGFVAREPWWTPPAQLRNLQSPCTVGVSYRFINQNREPEPGTDQLLQTGQSLNEVDGSVYLRLGNYLGFTFLARYD